MPRKRAPAALDARIVALASRQHGVVSRAQLLALGARAHQIDDRVDRGWLIRLHRGVYAVGHAALRIEGVWLAAVLACGPGSVLSHRDAAALWELRAASGTRVDVTVPTRNGRQRRAGIAVHRPSPLPEDEKTSVREIAVTTPARTLLDLAEVVSRPALVRAVEQAEVVHVLDLADLERVIASHPGRAGARRLVHVLTEQFSRVTITRSELEVIFLDVCAAAGLPRPQVNTPVGGLEVDFFWPTLGLVVEVDGFRFHGTRAAFERDRERDARLATLGLRVLRFTYRAITRDRRRVQQTLATVASRPQGAFPGI